MELSNRMNLLLHEYRNEIMNTTTQTVDRKAINYLVDITIFVAMLLALNPHMTGMAVHEWLSLAFGGAIITHLLLHWQWIVAVTRRFLGNITWASRLNYLVNLLFFIDMTIIIFTGIMISATALPTLGISFANSHGWVMLHKTAANLALPVLGLHVALHWRWIVNTTKRYLIDPWRGTTPVRRPIATHALQKGA